MPKRKILVMIDWFDPAYKAGGPIRSCVNFVTHMKEEYELFVFTSDRDLGMQSPLPDIRTDEWIAHNSGALVFYASPRKLNFAGMREVIKSIQPHFIYLNSFFSKYFAIYPLLISRYCESNAAMVLAPRGMLKPSALQFKSIKKKFFLGLIKLMGLHANTRFHATDDEEVKDIRCHFPENPVSFASSFSETVPARQVALKKESGTLAVLFIGRIHPIKNLHFLLNALKQVNGTIRLTIVGVLEQPSYWNDCQEIINSFPSTVRANYIGEVPHDQLPAIINDHHILALPTQGENFGHAIFEALSEGKPVLISDQTPWRNLRPQNAGWDLDLNQPLLFSQALQEAINWNYETYSLWSEAAYTRASQYADQSKLIERYKKIFS